MKILNRVLFCCLLISFLIFCRCGSIRPRRTIVVDPNEYLRKYGYYPEINQPHNRRLHRQSAIRLYQRMNGLKITGKINKRTIKMMSKPRCGNPDIVQAHIPASYRYRRQTFNKYKRTSQGDQWINNTLTWKISSFSNKLSWSDQQNIFEKIFKMWSAATPLKITYTTNDADIDISFARWIHGDGTFNAFDGKGRLLAHAYGPGDGDIAGDIHFDADEDWTVDYMSRRKHDKDFFATALHEAGHSLGLAHTTNKNAVMYSLYKGFEPEPTLDKDDIYKLQTLYGSDPYFTYRPKKKKLEQSMVNKPALCRVNVKAIFYGPSGRTYILTSYQVYRVNNFRLDKGFPMRTRRLLKNAPINPHASVYLQEYKRLYMFKGTKLWRYTNMKLDHGYPMHIQMGHPENPRAAVNIRDRRGRSRVFLFGNTYFWGWNYITEKSSGRPMLISNFWRGMPKSIDAAFRWKDGFIYVFKDQKYYKVSSRRRVVLPGYPKYFGPAWMGGRCGSQPK